MPLPAGPSPSSSDALAEARAARLATHRALSRHLSELEDAQLQDLLAAAGPWHAGAGGRSATIEILGTPCFVKRVPLTAVEALDAHTFSTADHVGLPPAYHYGLGSAGFGAWRELAVNLLTTRWERSGTVEAFTLLHGWRVLPDDRPDAVLDVLGGVDASVAAWGGHPGVRARLEAVGGAEASLVLVLEHVPQTLAAWFAAGRTTWAAEDDVSAFLWAAGQLDRTARSMARKGLVHFDLHAENVLTDGARLYVTDFGLAAHPTFDLSDAEAAFVTAHVDHDRAQIAEHLLHHHLPSVREMVHPDIAAHLNASARSSRVFAGFARALRQGDPTMVPYPAAELARALQDGAVGGDVLSTSDAAAEPSVSKF